MIAHLFEQPSRRSTLLAVSIVAAATLLAYSNTFHSPFYFDDYGYVIGNQFVEISDLSYTTLHDAAVKTPGKTRAFGNITFALNHFFFGNGVESFHVVNFLIHVAAAIVVYFLFLKTVSLSCPSKNSTSRLGILLASLLWALHPLHTNSVTYIVQRLNSLAGFLFLLSLLCYVHARTTGITSRKIILFIGSLGSGAAALFSKENAFMLPVMITAYEFFFLSNIREKKAQRFLIGLIGLAVICGVAFIFFVEKGNFLFFLSGYGSKDFTLTQRLLTESRVLFYYLSLYFLPLPGRFNLLHDFPLSTGLFSPVGTFFAVLGICFFCLGIFWLYKRNRFASFALLWFLGNLVLESTVIPLAIIFEHRTYLPTVFIPLALLTALPVKIQKSRAFLSVGAMLVILLLFCTWQRNQVWTNTYTFWSDIAQKSPGLSRGHLGVYFALKRMGKEKEAHAALLRAFAADPGDEKVVTNLVNTYMENRQFAKSIAVLDDFLTRKKTTSGFINRAKAQALLRHFNEAVRDADQALKITPQSGLALLIKGKALSALGLREKALEALKQAQKTGFKSALLPSSIGEVYINSGHIDLAIHYFQEALKIDPNHASSHYYLGLAYGRKGMKEKAKKEMEKGMYLRNNPIQRSNPHNFVKDHQGQGIFP